LIANSASKWEEGDKEFLLTLDEKQLEKMVPEVSTVEVKLDSEEFITAVKAEADKLVANSGGSAEKPQTVTDYIKAAPVEMQEVLSSGVRAFNSRKTELITSIKANKKNTFTDEVLTGFNLETLEKLSALAVTEDYTMQGGPRMNAEHDDPNTIPAPEPVFDLTPKSNGAAKE